MAALLHANRMVKNDYADQRQARTLRRMRAHMAWNVLIQKPLAGCRSWTRSRISPAALFVNVIARISFGAARPVATSQAIRRVITGALEIERREKRIGASLQGHPKVFLTGHDAAHLDGIDLAELSITSSITVTVGSAPDGAFSLPDEPEIGVVVTLAEGEKCERCWRVLAEVANHAGLCDRCADVVAAVPA